MATFSLDRVDIFGTGVLQAEGVVIDKDGSAYGEGRNGIVYRVTPDGTVSEMAHLPEGSMPNGVTMDREGNVVYCDLAKQAVLRVSQSGQVSFIADQVGDVKLTMPNFASYDAEGNLYVSNSSSAPTLEKALDELAQPAPNGALVRIRPDGQGDVVATGIYLANGTAIAPNEDAVYVQKGTHPGPSGHPSREGSFSYPLLGGVPRQRRGGLSPAWRPPRVWRAQVPGNVHHPS